MYDELNKKMSTNVKRKKIPTTENKKTIVDSADTRPTN